MKFQDLIDKVLKMDYPQELDKKWNGECPCFWCNPIINGHRIKIHGHCWRTTDNGKRGGCKCLNNGLHITGKLPKKDLMKLAKAFKKKLDRQQWYSIWEIEVKSLIKT